jgi:hypothetical protein
MADRPGSRAWDTALTRNSALSLRPQMAQKRWPSLADTR